MIQNVEHHSNLPKLILLRTFCVSGAERTWKCLKPLMSSALQNVSLFYTSLVALGLQRGWIYNRPDVEVLHLASDVKRASWLCGLLAGLKLAASWSHRSKQKKTLPGAIQLIAGSKGCLQNCLLDDVKTCWRWQTEKKLTQKNNTQRLQNIGPVRM